MNQVLIFHKQNWTNNTQTCHLHFIIQTQTNQVSLLLAAMLLCVSVWPQLLVGMKQVETLLYNHQVMQASRSSELTRCLILIGASHYYLTLGNWFVSLCKVIKYKQWTCSIISYVFSSIFKSFCHAFQPCGFNHSGTQSLPRGALLNLYLN